MSRARTAPPARAPACDRRRSGRTPKWPAASHRARRTAPARPARCGWGRCACAPRPRSHTPTASSADSPRARRAHESSSASRRPGPSSPDAGARQSPHQGARTPAAAATGRRPTCPAPPECPSSPAPAPPRATGGDTRSTPAQTTPTRSPRRRCWQTAAPVVAPPPHSPGRTDTAPGCEDDGYDAHRPRPRPR